MMEFRSSKKPSSRFSFGRWLKGFRARADLTQAELANKLGVCRNTIDGWERDMSRPGDRDKILNMRVPLDLDQAEINNLLCAAHYLPECEPLKAPHQLRSAIGDFVGRLDEVEILSTGMRAVLAQERGGAAIGIVRGMAGVGKTELAYAVAQELVPTFSDAQLVVELRGASSTPLSPIQALQTVIRAFEPGRHLSDDESELQALYRHYLDGKRVLILADDAKDAAQAQPLLPPVGCALLVTSRARFRLPGAVVLDLRVLPPPEAESLLITIWPHIDAAAAELAQLCGYLPLALRISASLLANDSRNRVSEYLALLKSESSRGMQKTSGRLAHLRDPDDPHASVEASIKLSYNSLPSAAQQALAQLGVFPASFDLAAAEAVVVGVGILEDTLGLLRRRSLLEWDEPTNRYALHDLVREFAIVQLPEADKARLALRHAQHYQRVASNAQDDLYLKGNALAGLALFDLERAHIDAGWAWAQAYAGDPEVDTLLLAYADATYVIAPLRYHVRDERIPQLRAQLAAARRLGRRDHEGYALGNLGNTYVNLGQVKEAIGYYKQSLTIWRELGDRRSEGRILDNLGNARQELGEVAQALVHHEQALSILRDAGDGRGKGEALDNLGNAYRKLGKVAEAIGYYEQSLTIWRELGDRHGEGSTLDNLGNAYRELGEVAQAHIYHEQALAIMQDINDQRGEAITSWNLGKLLSQQGDLARAVALMQIRVGYEVAIDHPDVDKHAARLEQLRQRLTRKRRVRGKET